MYVNLQVPENVSAERRENAYEIKKIREENKGKAYKLRTQYQVKN